MKISEYPLTDTFSLDDLLVISGVAGDRRITTERLLVHKPKGAAGHAIIDLLPGNWTDALTQTIALPSDFGMGNNTVFLWDLAYGTSTDQYHRFSSSGIRDIAQTVNSVTFKAFYFKPDILISLELWNVGGNG